MKLYNDSDPKLFIAFCNAVKMFGTWESPEVVYGALSYIRSSFCGRSEVFRNRMSRELINEIMYGRPFLILTVNSDKLGLHNYVEDVEQIIDGLRLPAVEIYRPLEEVSIEALNDSKADSAIFIVAFEKKPNMRFRPIHMNGKEYFVYMKEEDGTLVKPDYQDVKHPRNRRNNPNKIIKVKKMGSDFEIYSTFEQDCEYIPPVYMLDIRKWKAKKKQINAVAA